MQEACWESLRSVSTSAKCDLNMDLPMITKSPSSHKPLQPLNLNWLGLGLQEAVMLVSIKENVFISDKSKNGMAIRICR